MKINKLYDDVYEIVDFVTQEELDEVYNIINKTPEDGWFDEHKKEKYNIPDFWFGKQLCFEDLNILDSINEKMKNLFISFDYYPPKLNLQRYKKGDFIKHHADQWRTDIDYYIGYGFCLYYNDDYDGGELDYPDLKITIKPKAKALYIHGGHIVHGSLPVLNDKIRYFSTVFVHGRENAPTKLNPELFN